MALIKSAFFIVFACVTLIFADPEPKIKCLEYNITVTPNNPYYGQWSAEIIPPGYVLNIKTPTIKDIPEDLQFKFVILVDDEVVLIEEILLCEAMEIDDWQLLIEHGVPKDKFWKHCPIKTCEECEIINYTITTNRVPPGFPATIFRSKSIVYKDDENAPYIRIDAKFELHYN